MRRFWSRRLGRRGVAAVEFALVMPVLLVMFIGTVEVLTLYRMEAKLNALAMNVAEMVAVEDQATTTGTGGNNGITTLAASGAAGTTSLNDICNGAVLGLRPFPASGLTVAVAGVTLESQTASTAAYDAWEGDSTVSGSACTTTAGVKIGLVNAFNLAAGAGKGFTGSTSGMIEVPCDEAIIVQASMTYPGFTGIVLTSKPTLTQTAYVRWPYATPKTELQCSGCTVSNAATQVCNNNNSATN